MKKILIIAAISITAFSCKKLDEAPTAFVVKEQFYKTQADAVAGVTAVYATLTTDPGEQPMYGRHINFITDMTTDDLAAGPSAINPNVRSLSAVTYTSTNDRLQVQWRQLYTGINRANIAIDQITPMAIDTTLRNRLVREAKFLRGLFYFNLVRLWGDVPLVLHDATSTDLNSLKTNRTPLNEVYTQIISDLTAAEALPATYSGANLGRATGGAAKALLVKVYLTRKDWKAAITKAKEVINGPYGYALFDNFADVFNKTLKNTRESIFAAQFESNGGLGNSSILMGASFTGFTGSVPADIPADTSLYKLYSPNDTRRAVTFYTTLTNPNTGQPYNFPTPYFSKYVDKTVLLTPSQSGINFPILRYADLLLMYAEALNEDEGPTADAYEAINMVRRRAFGKAIKTTDATIDLTGLTQASLRDAIYKERRLEFVQEAQRWFDLVRTGRLVQEVSKVATKTAVSNKNYLFPIPQSEISLNAALTQNTGY